MSEQCPNCGQLANSSFSRLVKDSCGHTKCRMCLVYEEHGCKICQAERRAQDVRDYSKESHIQNGSSSHVNKAASEEIALPLELVIHKDPKFTEIRTNSVSFESRAADLYQKNDTFEKAEKVHETPTIATGDSEKVYIPKIETRDVVLNIEAHLRDDSNHHLSSLKNTNDSQVTERISEEAAEKSKSARSRDRSHITVIAGSPESYKCNACGKTFRNKKGKCYHDACVTGVRPYQCTFCDKTFVKRSHFEYHERVHKGYKPYKCELCDKAFPQKNKLNRHMFSHSKEKQFACKVCDKRYSKPDDLRNHSNVHNATTTYNCKSCNKSFRVLANLNRHMRTHTSERPHKCDQCDKSFKDRFLLVRHKRTHGKERPFSCARCNRVFLSKSELRRHTTVHSDEKPFSCEHCQTLFRRKDNLNRHIRHHHTEGSGYEASKAVAPVIETAADPRSNLAKGNQQPRQRQKPRKTQSKSPGAASAGSRDQINSRLDPMGNITSVIRATSEVSNAVPVINGPINIRRLEDVTDKKTLYTEPIPFADAVVLNRRIEEKLYPQIAKRQ